MVGLPFETDSKARQDAERAFVTYFSVVISQPSKQPLTFDSLCDGQVIAQALHHE